MTTQQDAFDERLTRLEGEVRDIKTLLGENALVQSQILNLVQQQVERLDGIDRRLNGFEHRFDGLDRRMDGLEQRMDGLDRRMDGLDQRMDGFERRLDGLEQHLDRVDRRTEDIARHLGVPPRNGAG